MIYPKTYNHNRALKLTLAATTICLIILYPEIASAATDATASASTSDSSSTKESKDLLEHSQADDLIAKIEATMGGKGGKILTVLSIIAIVGIGAINKAAMYGAAGTVIVLKGGTSMVNKIFSVLF